jgi:3-phosphoshikimate 1-carboxyvinyltransferase
VNVTIQPSKIAGVIQASASKSSMQRACAAALLAKGTSILRNPGYSNDDKAAVRVIKALGSTVEVVDDGSLKIISSGINPKSRSVNCGESGLGIRMFAPIIALSDKEFTIDGEGSLLSRPMEVFDEVLPGLNVKCKTKNGKLPLIIEGPLIPAEIQIDGSLSSQFLTGLLMAYSAADAKNVSIKVINLKSRPYIDLTLQVMKQFGLKLPKNKNYTEFHYSSTTHNSQLTTHNYTVEGDWSGAAFLLVAAAIAGKVEVTGIQNTSTQADKRIVDAILDAGAEVKVEDDKVHVEKKQLEAFVFDATDCPDLFPPLVALAANCNGISRIRGLKRLKHKESDRGKTLKEEFDKLSIQIDLNDDEMLVHGGGVFVKEHILNSHHDHRIAMACAVAGLGADFDVEIRNAEAVNKSYPDFWKHLQSLGGSVSLADQTINK